MEKIFQTATDYGVLLWQSPIVALLWVIFWICSGFIGNEFRKASQATGYRRGYPGGSIRGLLSRLIWIGLWSGACCFTLLTFLTPACNNEQVVNVVILIFILTIPAFVAVYLGERRG